MIKHLFYNITESMMIIILGVSILAPCTSLFTLLAIAYGFNVLANALYYSELFQKIKDTMDVNIEIPFRIFKLLVGGEVCLITIAMLLILLASNVMASIAVATIAVFSCVPVINFYKHSCLEPMRQNPRLPIALFACGQGFIFIAVFSNLFGFLTSASMSPLVAIFMVIGLLALLPYRLNLCPAPVISSYADDTDENIQNISLMDEDSDNDYPVCLKKILPCCFNTARSIEDAPLQPMSTSETQRSDDRVGRQSWCPNLFSSLQDKGYQMVHNQRTPQQEIMNNNVSL